MQVAFEPVPDKFISNTAFFDYKDGITEALAKINKLGAIVVMKDGEYYGIVDDRTIARKGDVKLTKQFSVGKFASKVPIIDDTTSIDKAIYYLYSADVKALPYHGKRKISGIVKRDEMLKAILSMHMLSDYKVKDIMSTPVIAVDSEMAIASAKVAMHQNKINRLVVLSNGKLFGIMTYKDMFQYAARLRERQEKLERYILPDAKVSEIAERDIYTIGHSESVDDAIRDMVINNVSSIVAVRSGKPVGILTPRDIFETIANSRGLSQDNIIISGLDSYTKEYETDIIEELQGFDSKISRFHRIGIDMIALNVKRSKVRNYELRIRVWLKHRGVIAAFLRGYSLEQTLRDLLAIAYNSIKNKKDIVYSNMRQSERIYE